MTSAVLIRGASGQFDRGLNATADLMASQDLLHAVSQHPELGAIVRVYRPAPTLAFSRRESHLPRFAEAVAEASAFGYEPVIRPAGGRAVALDAQWLVLDVITPELTRRDNTEVYRDWGQRLVDLAREHGVDARLGPVEGEYCPGEYSVNARGVVKLFGTAQRVSRHARLFSASVALSISPIAAELLDRVNRLLELDWSPATLGSLAVEAPGWAAESVEHQLAAAFAGAHAPECSLADIQSAIEVVETEGCHV
ncbi:MAG: lipoyl protein ligase domain-containing protein [Agromyces sp.]